MELSLTLTLSRRRREHGGDLLFSFSLLERAGGRQRGSQSAKCKLKKAN
jgi:hypothetical protein